MHIGDIINQSGPGSIGKIQVQGSAEPQVVLRELISLASDLRPQVAEPDRTAIDASVSVLKQGDRADSTTLRRALGNLMAIATAVGSVGTPLLDAALKAKQLLGL